MAQFGVTAPESTEPALSPIDTDDETPLDLSDEDLSSPSRR